MNKVVKKMTDLYFRRKLNSEQSSISLNKAILFFVDEVSTIDSNERYDDLEYYYWLMSKLSRKINKQTLVRLSHLLKEKEQLAETEPCKKMLELINGEVKKIDKVTKKKGKKQSKKPEQEEPDSDSGSDSESGSDDEEGPGSPVNERAMMRPNNPNARQTRSMTKPGRGNYIKVES